jgi:hypothetical protein
MHDPNFCLVKFPDYGGLVLEVITPLGERIPGILSATVETDANQMPTVTVKMACIMPWQLSFENNMPED